MKRSLFANLVAFAFFASVLACSGLFRWELLVFQLVLQSLTNELWYDVFVLPFAGQQLFGVEKGCLADPARVRRVARWTSFILLLLPAVTMAAMAAVNYWGEGALGRALHLPLEASLFIPSLAAQSLLLASTLGWGLPPLSYNTVYEALMARHERRLKAEGRYPEQKVAAATPLPPTRAGVEVLPHGLPEGLVLPPCLQSPQRCSPRYAAHAELVRSRLREGERAVVSTAPAGVVPLPSSSNERTLGGVALCLAALLLYTSMGLFEDAGSRVVTRWAVLLAGLVLLPVAVAVLRAASRRQALLRYTDYFLTNYRLHICCDGEWVAVSFAAVEVVLGGSHEEGRRDVVLCPEHGAQTYDLVNVEHAEELCALLEHLIAREQAR